MKETPYVRSWRDAETLVAKDRRVVVAMRLDANGVGRRAALTLLEIRRRGYVIGWDSVVAAVQMMTPNLRVTNAEALAKGIADYLILHEHCTPEEDREALARQYAEELEFLDPDADDPPGERKARSLRYFGMLNRAMRDKLERGECVDLSTCERAGAGCYIVPPDVWQSDVDFCDADLEVWIRSIGRMHATGVILASTDNRFYMNDACECLFLR